MRKYRQFNIKLVRILFTAIFLISGFYLYFLNATIGAAIESKNDSQKMEALNQKYQSLEGEYFSLLGKVTIDYAHQLGFVDGTGRTDYVVRENAVAYGGKF